MTRRQLTDGSEPGVGSELAGVLNMIAVAAKDKDVDPVKLSQMMDLYERVEGRQAERVFTDAMSKCQEEMKSIRPNRSNAHTGAKYPTYDALDRVLRPIYTKHGFSVTFDTGKGDLDEPVPSGEVRVWLLLSHVGGHTVKKHVDMPLPSEGSRGGSVMTKTQATGAAMSYGSRYLLKFAFNIAVGEDDRDGNGPTPRREREEQSPSPQSKSERKQEGREERKAPSKGRPAGYDSVQKAKTAATRIADSSYKTLSSAMRRERISEERFEQTFGFKLAELDKSGAGKTVDWIKEESS